MVQDNYRKIKLLKLLELLRLDTDEQHPMTTNQICARLDEMGILSSGILKLRSST